MGRTAVIRFGCPRCNARVFFEDSRCVRCGALLRYDPAADAVVLGDDAPGCRTGAPWDCNWQAAPDSDRCSACALSHDVAEPGPDVTVFQAAVRRVVRQLRLTGIRPAAADPALRFDLLRSSPDRTVTIGHTDGLVTLDVAEGNPARLADVQNRLGEPYRTPLGHVRHECGHWHWQMAVAGNGDVLRGSRDLFGDERADYAAALQRHYDSADDGSWRPDYVSFYAAAHPWEDYAESFAHVLHLLAIVETAQAEGFVPGFPAAPSFADLVGAWGPLTVSLNELARSMGTPQPYPFAPPAPAVAKMAFVHDLLTGTPTAT